MTGEILTAVFTALWTGIITSVSPCPLATNIAALTYISRHSGSGRLAVLLHGALYALGRSLTYVFIGFLLVKGLLGAPSFSFFMQQYGNQLLSPLLVLAGMYMLGLIGRGFEGFNFVNISRFKARGGAVASLTMGLLFALTFCPISAAMYFGVIIPLAASRASHLWILLFYGIGTALPVLSIAVALDFSLKKISGITGLASIFDKYARPATGWIFIAAGAYMGLKYIFGLF